VSFTKGDIVDRTALRVDLVGRRVELVGAAPRIPDSAADTGALVFQNRMAFCPDPIACTPRHHSVRRNIPSSKTGLKTGLILETMPLRPESGSQKD
jgi:hypothetical protein